MASDPCLEERNAVEAQLVIVANIMADLGMQIAELDARIQNLEGCEAENQNPMPMSAVIQPGFETSRLTSCRRHLIPMCETLRKELIAMQAICDAMKAIAKG